MFDHKVQYLKSVDVSIFKVKSTQCNIKKQDFDEDSHSSEGPKTEN